MGMEFRLRTWIRYSISRNRMTAARSIIIVSNITPLTWKEFV
jgi:hypothetical protein